MRLLWTVLGCAAVVGIGACGETTEGAHPGSGGGGASAQGGRAGSGGSVAGCGAFGPVCETPNPPPAGSGGTSFAGSGGTAPGTSGRGGAGPWPDLGDAGGSALCGIDFAGGIYCSAEDTCRALDCGEAWSLFDAEGCAREVCDHDGVCPAGQRCVPAPVGGEFTEHCFQEYDGCDTASGACRCYQYEECGPRAVCLDEGEFPEASDCPIAGLGCAELATAAATVRAYIDRDGWFAEGGAPSTLSDLVDDCAARIDAALAACP